MLLILIYQLREGTSGREIKQICFLGIMKRRVSSAVIMHSASQTLKRALKDLLASFALNAVSINLRYHTGVLGYSDQEEVYCNKHRGWSVFHLARVSHLLDGTK